MPASSSGPFSHGAYAHSGSQKPPPHSPNRWRCESMPTRSCSSIDSSSASSGRIAWVAEEVQLACAAECLQQAAVLFEPLERVGGGRVLGGRALQLCDRAGVAGLPELLDVEPVRLGPDLAQEHDAALDRPRRLKLVAQHRRQRERQLRAALVWAELVEHPQQRHIARRRRLPQPLLAERPCPEALHVGHVGVEDDRELALRHGSEAIRAAPDAGEW